MATGLAKKLQIRDNSRVWVTSGEVLTGPAVDALLDGISQADRAADADVALIGLKNAAAAEFLVHGDLAQLAGARAVWLIYPKGNRTDINRDTLWQQLLVVGWRAVANVAVDDVLSALRVRPLKPGERDD